MNDFFKKPGDLNALDKDISSKSMDSFFRKPGDVDSNRGMSSFFRNPGDIESASEVVNLNTKKDIEEYLISIVSGKKYANESELGTLIGGGNTIVDLNRLQEMVDLGYNIVSAKYINNNMIMVEFQEFKKNDSRGMGR